MDTTFVFDTVMIADSVAADIFARIAERWDVNLLDASTIAGAAILIVNWLKARVPLGGWRTLAANAGASLVIWALLEWPAFGQIIVGATASTAIGALGWRTLRTMLSNGAPPAAAPPAKKKKVGGPTL